MSEHPTVWALKIQPNSAADEAVSYEFCKARSIVGTGWGLDERFESKEDALEAHRSNGATDQYGNVRFPIRAMIRRASVGDYVWVNEGSEYALCRIESEWRQHPVSDTGDEWTANDIHNYRDASWRIIESAIVPGYVKRYFAAPRVPTMARPDGGKTQRAKRYATELFEENPDQITELVVSMSSVSRSRKATSPGCSIFSIPSKQRISSLTIYRHAVGTSSSPQRPEHSRESNACFVGSNPSPRRRTFR